MRIERNIYREKEMLRKFRGKCKEFCACQNDGFKLNFVTCFCWDKNSRRKITK